MNTASRPALRAGMVGMGMIFDETYRPFFERAHGAGVHDRRFGDIDVPLVAVATRTGMRALAYQSEAKGKIADFRNLAGPDAVDQLLDADPHFVCVATPDNRHFEPCKKVLASGVHL